MKHLHIIYIIGITGHLWAACSSEGNLPEQPVSPQQPEEIPISLGGSIGEMSETQSATRAGTSLASEGVTSFMLYGYKDMPDGTRQTVFDGYTVEYTENTAGTTTSNSSGWEYVSGTAGTPADFPANQTIKYWDMNATAYRFYGYAPATLNVAPQETPRTHSMNFQVNAATEPYPGPYITQLWFSDNSSSEEPFQQTVQLVFQKPLCRVRFIINGSDGTPLQPYQAQSVSNISFAPTSATTTIQYLGNVHVTFPLTGNPTDTGGEVFSFAESSDGYKSLTIPYESERRLTGEGEELNKWYPLLPNETQGSYSLSLKQNGKERTATVPAEYMKWKMGYEYTYVFKLSTEGSLVLQAAYGIYSRWQAGYVETTTW